jgi:hypothetical protein
MAEGIETMKLSPTQLAMLRFYQRVGIGRLCSFAPNMRRTAKVLARFGLLDINEFDQATLTFNGETYV